MITQSYSEQEQYTGSVEEHLVPPQITTSSKSINREKAKYTLKPGDPEDLAVQSNGQYQHTNAHVKDGRTELGWTERDYLSSASAGGMVRNAILSGSYGELKKLRVDSEVNSETITTSWSASISENLRVGRNAGVAGYVNIGDTGSLITSSQKGVSPQPDFAPNDENIANVRLVVSDSAIIQNDLYVKDSASISGGLDVKGDTRLASNLYVTGTAEVTESLKVVGRSYLTGNVQVVGNEAITGSLHVSKGIYGSENLYLTGNAEITGNAQIVGDEAVTGSLHVVESIYGSENLYLTGSAYITGGIAVSGDEIISGNLQVVGDEAVTGSLHVSESIYGSENLYLSGNAHISESLHVSKSLDVTGSAYIQQELLVSGNTRVSSSLRVDGTSSFGNDATFDESVHVVKDVIIDGDINVKGTASYINTQDLYVKDKSITIACGSVSPEQANGAGIDIAGADIHFHYTASSDRMGLNKGLDILGEENVTGSLHVTENFYLNEGTAYISNSVLTQSLVLTQSVSQSTVLSQSVTNQTVVTQSVTSSSVQNLTVVSESVQNIQIVSGNAEYLKVEKLEISGSDPAVFHGDVCVEGDVSGSNSGSFKNLYVENNATIGNTASIDHFLEITANDGEGDSVNINTGSIRAEQSDLFIHNITGSGTITAPIVSGGVFYGDGRYLANVTSSVASSSTWKSYLDFTAGATQRLAHPFKTTDVFVQVYRWDDPNFHPDLSSGSSFSSPATRVNEAVVKIIDDDFIDISNATAVNGYAVISDAGMLITASVDVVQVAADYAEYTVTPGNEKTIYRFDHKLGTKNLIINVYQYVDVKDGYGTVMPVQIFPEQIAIPDTSHVDIVFGRTGTGYIVLGKAGHVIPHMDPSDFIDEWNVHYGSSGDWTAHRFSATSLSADVVTAADYVDAHIVGNRDSGPQYYTQNAWGSYTEYTDTGINEWVRYSNDELDVRQVSNIDKNGNLTIRGNLITNGSFSTSDIRKKNIIGNVENALEGIEKINGVRFYWRGSGNASIGVIAQDINAIYPELTKVVPDLDGKEEMVVNYEGLIGVLVEAVKELSSKVKTLENKLENENR